MYDYRAYVEEFLFQLFLNCFAASWLFRSMVKAIQKLRALVLTIFPSSKLNSLKMANRSSSDPGTSRSTSST